MVTRSQKDSQMKPGRVKQYSIIAGKMLGCITRFEHLLSELIPEYKTI